MSFFVSGLKLPHIWKMQNAVTLSVDLLTAIQNKRDFSDLKNELSIFDRQALFADLSGDDDKKAFWLNIYNAFIIILLNNNPSLLLSPLARKREFSEKIINVSGYLLSLDDVEHGLIRNSESWWSGGYLKKLLPLGFKNHLLACQMDPRMHFAIKWSGENFPSVTVFQSKQLTKQLDRVTNAFLLSDIDFDEKLNIIHINELFDWYLGDFGFKEGLLDFLIKYKVIPEKTPLPKFIFRKYDWELLRTTYSV